MTDKVLIFGKNTWPHTTAAREAHEKQNLDFDYIDVKSDPDKLDSMLKHSKGQRKVPVIVAAGSVTIGWEGKTWGV